MGLNLHLFSHSVGLANGVQLVARLVIGTYPLCPGFSSSWENIPNRPCLHLAGGGHFSVLFLSLCNPCNSIVIGKYVFVLVIELCVCVHTWRENILIVIQRSAESKNRISGTASEQLRTLPFCNMTAQSCLVTQY